MIKTYRHTTLDSVKAANAGEYFGTLQESVTEAWREHLKTAKYSAHMALDEYYNEMPEKVDKFIEAYIAVRGSKIMDYSCKFRAKNMTPIEYLKLLKRFLEDGRDEYCGEHSELNSGLDDIVGLIDSTLYKLKELRESEESMKNLVDFIKESLVSESMRYTGPKRVTLKDDFAFCTVDEYRDAPEEFEGFDELIQFAQANEKDFVKHKEYIIPKGTKVEYEGQDDMIRDLAIFSVQSGPAKGMLFKVFSDLANEMN